MICTLELLKLKMQNHSFSKSEQIFFGLVNDLKRNYLKMVNRQDIKAPVNTHCLRVGQVLKEIIYRKCLQREH